MLGVATLLGISACAAADLSVTPEAGAPTSSAETSAVPEPSTTPETTPRGNRRDRPASPGPSASPTRPPLAERAEKRAKRAERKEPRVDRPVLGADASWPQCPKGMGLPEKQGLGIPMPLPEAKFVVLGLTNGPGFYPNPCLASQVDWVRERDKMAAAYAVASYPEQRHLARHGRSGPFDGDTRLGRLANTGYAQAEFNVRTMRGSGLRSPIVWIDVEPVPDYPWSDDAQANFAVVRGLARAYRDAGFRIGVYSTAYLWEQVVGDFELGVPEWRAAGKTSRAAALAKCGPESQIQGGPAFMGQWVGAGRDQNVTCPGRGIRLSRWFHQY